MKLSDFHTHTLLPDGVLTPAELIRRLIVRGLDILAHPGILTMEEVQIAKDNDVFLEITTRGGHSLGNGLVAELAMKTGAKLILNTDSHSPRDFLTKELREKTALGAGTPETMFEEMFVKNPEELVKRIVE